MKSVSPVPGALDRLRQTGCHGASQHACVARQRPAPGCLSEWWCQCLVSVPRPFTQNVQTGQRFSVLAPFASKTGLVHTTSADNNSANLSRIDSSALNGLSFAIAIPLQQWTGTYHDVPISMAWTNGSGGRWQIRNEDGSAMPVGMNFNVAAAPLLSPNAAQVLSGGQIVRELPVPSTAR